MVDGRLPSVISRPPQAVPQAPARGAAQRAFFDAALSRAAPAAPAASTALQPAVTPVTSTTVASAPEPGGRYRPGTLLDIKI